MMKMRQCSCGRPVSPRANACPHCGAPFGIEARAGGSWASGCIAIILGVITVLVLVALSA